MGEIDMRPFTPVPKPVPRGKKSKTKIKPVSTKQAKALTEYAKVRKQFLAEHLYCQANLTGCLIVADQIHHQASRIGAKLTDPSNLLAVCGVCHRFIEDNPTEALKMGFSKSRLHE
jgi:hypothetical protein